MATGQRFQDIFLNFLYHPKLTWIIILHYLLTLLKTNHLSITKGSPFLLINPEDQI